MIIDSLPLFIIIGVIIALFAVYAIMRSKIRKSLKPFASIIAIVTVAVLCSLIITKTHIDQEINIASSGDMTENELPREAIDEDKFSDCVIIREDEICINNDTADMEDLTKYLDYRVENNIQVILVDDYSSSEFFHSIIDYFEERGVNYIIKDETWLQE